MRNGLALLCGIFLLTGFSGVQVMAQGQQGNAQPPTFQVTSKLVFLDVTVVDKKGRPVVTGLTQDDFTIMENKQPQAIFSFEAPEAHTLKTRPGGENPNGEAPVTILVLDQLDSSFEDFAFLRWEVRRYLEAQPATLRSPAELMVVGNQSLELVQSYTRSRSDLLDALKHVPTALPYKQMSPSFWAERFVQSIDALQEIALENQGVPGRKNIVWLGHGGPAVNTMGWPQVWIDKVNEFVHSTTNMLVDARATLFVLYPGLKVQAPATQMSALDASVHLGDGDPFAGDVNFGVFVDETGGKLFYNRNDVDEEMRDAERMGSEYYTLTYQPHNSDDNGRFERIRVTLRDPNLRAVTKAGYFAPDAKSKIDPRQRFMYNLSTAVRSSVPFDALGVSVGGVVRHSDSQTAEFLVIVEPKNLGWQAGDDGRDTAELVLAAASLNGRRDILASKMQTWNVAETKKAEDAGNLIPLKVTLRLPKRTQTVRVVIETQEGGRMGTAEVARKTIDTAPEAPTPQP